jgi:hypothetical protein
MDTSGIGIEQLYFFGTISPTNCILITKVSDFIVGDMSTRTAARRIETPALRPLPQAFLAMVSGSSCSCAAGCSG